MKDEYDFSKAKRPWQLLRENKELINIIKDLLSYENKRRYDEEFLAQAESKPYYNGYWITKEKAEEILKRIEDE